VEPHQARELGLDERCTVFVVFPPTHEQFAGREWRTGFSRIPTCGALPDSLHSICGAMWRRKYGESVCGERGRGDSSRVRGARCI